MTDTTPHDTESYDNPALYDDPAMYEEIGLELTPQQIVDWNREHHPELFQ